VYQRIAGLGTWCGRSMPRGRAANGCPVVVMRMVLGVLGILTGTVRHRHSRAVPTGDRDGQARARDLTVSWLIFSEWTGLNYSGRTCANTSSAWPSTFTLRQILMIRPSVPIRKVVRRMPWKVLPYIDFSPQTP